MNNREEIYDRLASAYLERNDRSLKEKKKSVNVWWSTNVLITVVILGSSFWAFTAFLASREHKWQQKVQYALTNSPLRINYDVREPYPQVKTLTLDVPRLDATKYGAINLSLRATDEGSPGTIKMVVKNQLNEQGSHYIHNIDEKWQDLKVNFDQFGITDWSSVDEVAFVIEAWNADKQKGVILIDDLSFSN